MTTRSGLSVRSTVEYSPCGLYRYSLIRVWDTSLSRCVFVMLNPSPADAERNDPTVVRKLVLRRRIARQVLPPIGYRL